ncbi:MAG: efflux RND transporter periplasmic adaptor subunit [Rikenellaceae bacterium]
MRFFKGLVLLLALSLVSCKSTVKSDSAPRKVKSESVVTSNESVEVATFTGKVVAATDVNLGFRVAGIIDCVELADGAFVREGEVIARLDSRDYALQLAATQAEYDAVKAEVDRVVALYADQSVSANDYDKATNGLRAITAKFEAHQNALSDTALKAPFDGYIQRSYFDRGEAVAAGTPVVAIISSSAPEITIDIPAAYYLKENSFESATASVELYGGIEFPLTLKGISRKANLNQLYKATFVVGSVDGITPAVGVSAIVSLNYSKSQEQGVQIPFSAVVERNGKSSVWVVSEGKVASRTVAISEILSNGTARISSGLEAGEVIATAGVNSLKEGQEVIKLPEATASNVGGVK